MDWRVWTKQTLDGSAALVALVPVDAIFGAGAIEESPTQRPFIEIKLDGSQRGPFPGVSSTNLTVWVHDRTGDYMLIDSIIDLVKDVIAGVDREAQVALPDGVTARWLGDSPELFDDGYRTLTRNTVFQLNKKEM